MTALVVNTDVPSDIVTLEQLSVWCHACLANLNSNINATEGENYSVRAAQSGTYYIPSTDVTRHVGRISVELGPDYIVGGRKPWLYAKELSTKPLTVAMKAN
jgi:hypothetical protein